MNTCRSVDYDQRDFRAWNGLGQTYETLKMHYYALNYYQRATAIRPYDGRIWCAMGQCYESLDQDLAAIKCYTRALLGPDQEKTALKKLPKLYKKIGESDAAAHYFRKSLEQFREEQVRVFFVVVFWWPWWVVYRGYADISYNH